MSKLYPCVYCTEDGYCKKYSDAEVTAWCVQSPCKDEKPSNADKLRAMTDEELAEWILSIQQDIVSYYACEKYVPELPVERHTWLDWLRQEAN